MALDFLNKGFDWIFAPITNNLNPTASLILISFLLTAAITYIYKKLTNQTILKEMREEVNKLRNKMKEVKDDKEKLMEIQKQMMEKDMALMKHSLRPTLYTFLPIILIFSWLRVTFDSGSQYLTWGFNIPLFGTGFGWLGTYILVSLITSLVLRKIFKIY